MRAVRTGRKEKGLSKVMLLVIILVFLLLTGGSTALALYLGGMLGAPAEDAVAEGEAGEEGAEAEPPKPPPQYLPIEPALVVNFDYKGRVGFLQADIEIMAREQAAVSGVQQHMPVIRNNLLLLLSSTTYEDVATRQGKEQLAQDAREEVNKVLAEQGVEAEIEAVYFTGFVMQ
ncbi:flagellar basal body-associated FliL family protein [Ectothiorhodospiraceae bacterium WFHF3C12]|nr:flagellar basal body-associated FliL family protein [Ectothiorhodospiraceae bacterium WFHF3C12]